MKNFLKNRRDVRDKLEAYRKGKYTPEVIVAPPAPAPPEEKKKEKEKQKKEKRKFPKTGEEGARKGGPPRVGKP